MQCFNIFPFRKQSISLASNVAESYLRPDCIYIENKIQRYLIIYCFQRRLKLETSRSIRDQIGGAKQVVTHYIQLSARVHYAHARI